MSCLTFTFSRVGGDIQVSVERLGEEHLSINSECNTALKVRSAIVCRTGIGEIYLWSCEGLLLSAENGKFILKKI